MNTLKARENTTTVVTNVVASSLLKKETGSPFIIGRKGPTTFAYPRFPNQIII